MADSVPDGDDEDGRIDEYVFSCAVCGQEIAVNPEMRGAILTHGCPVCTSEVDETDFTAN